LFNPGNVKLAAFTGIPLELGGMSGSLVQVPAK
jgi:hypothetical protein